LERFIHVPVKHYSSGMYVRLGFAIAVHTEPEILLVDEVLAVGDARFQHKCLDRIAQMRRQGISIVLVSHDLASIQSLCDRAIFLQDGRIMAEGRPDRVTMSYLNVVAAQESADSDITLDETQEGERWGTGRMQITKVELCDDQGQPSGVFVTGCTMEIRMHYRADEPIEDPIFGVAIHHQNGTLVCGPNTGFDRISIPQAHGEGLVIYRIPCLPLLEGGYEVSTTVHNRADTELYDGHQRAYKFRVYPGKARERYGLVTVNGEWEIRD
jgi:lipopolysaccharide transport system ATP-binding protein